MNTKTNPAARRTVSMLLLMFCLMAGAAMTTTAQTSTFTYQGRFSDTSVAQQPTNGTYSMTFRLYDAATGGTQIGSAVTAASVVVVNGIFTVPLDFGATAFNTTGARYLEIQVGSTVLTPRQEITSTPFARKATNAGAADALSSQCAGCVTDSQISAVSGSKVTGTVNSAITATSAGTAGSANTANSATTATTATNAQQLGGVAASNYLQTNGSGASVTNLNASNLASGTVPLARLGTNTPSATTYLRGDNTWQPVSSGSNVSPFGARSTAVTLNSGTLVDLVSINLEANKTYFLEGNIIGNRVGSTSGAVRCRTAYSGTATTDYGLQQLGTLFNLTTIDSSGAYDTESTGQTANSLWAAAVTYRYTINGYLRTSTAGTMTISCGRASTNTTVDLTVREGSYLTARPLN